MASISESKFQAWRACVAVIFLDSTVSNEESRWVEEKIKILPLTNDQRLILIKDLKTGISLSETLSKITDKKDLAFVVDTFRVLGNIDNKFSSVEKESFKKLESQVLQGLDLVAISREIEKLENESYHEDEVYKSYNKSSVFEKTANKFLKFLNPDD